MAVTALVTAPRLYASGTLCVVFKVQFKLQAAVRAVHAACFDLLPGLGASRLLLTMPPSTIRQAHPIVQSTSNASTTTQHVDHSAAAA
jgi:hypothetical protein